ncbi:MAG: RNA methyltransferase [Thermodesulfobacteriota bacterium]
MNRSGETVASAVTNLDLHDIARAGRTYGVRSFYVVTPLEDQRDLAGQLVDHWLIGAGAKLNPARKAALELIRIRETVEAAVEEIESEGQGRPRRVATGARPRPGSIGHDRFRDMINDGAPYLLQFGTAWGLAEEVFSAADYILRPINGPTEYNHLSVRSAASILMDRLLGER